MKLIAPRRVQASPFISGHNTNKKKISATINIHLANKEIQLELYSCCIHLVWRLIIYWRAIQKKMKKENANFQVVYTIISECVPSPIFPSTLLIKDPTSSGFPFNFTWPICKRRCCGQCNRQLKPSQQDKKDL